MFAFLCAWRLTAADVGHTLSIVIPTTWTGNRKCVSITHSLALQLKVDGGLLMMHRASPPTSAGGATLTVSIQPLVQRPHHLGAAEALEAIPHVVVVPASGSNLHHPADGQPVTVTAHLDRWSS